MKYAFTLMLCFCISLSFQLSAQSDTGWLKSYSNPSHRFDYGRDIAVDASGNVYAGGHSLLDDVQDGGVRIVKYAGDGTQLWTYGTVITDSEYMEHFAIDPDGNQYYIGYKWDSFRDHMVTAKLDPSGSVLWKSFYNDSVGGWDYGQAICIDGAKNVYVSGWTTVTGGYEIATYKYSPSGELLWGRHHHNPLPSYFNWGYDIALDKQGGVYVCGYEKYDSVHMLTVVKYDTDGNEKWADTVNTHSLWETETAKTYLKIDAANNIYVLGETMSPATNADILLVKYSRDGNLIWKQMWNSPTNDSDYVGNDFYDGVAMLIDSAQNVFVSGTITPVGGVLFKENIVTLKYDSSGTLLWSNIFDGEAHGEDRPYGLALDKHGNAYVCGQVDRDPGSLGYIDYLTYKLDATTGDRLWMRTYNGAVDFYDEAHAITVDTADNVYVTGWSATTLDFTDLTANMVTIKYVQSATGVKEIVSGAISVYPNPANDLVHVTIPESDATLYVVNMAGQKVYELPEMKKPANGYLNIPVADWPVGMYNIVIATGERFYTQKVSVVH